ncbi:enkurin-like [Lingula anatina]|uniref:Enkurin n=1 Tax=Lingula anatina TaxID=7574 RepID=A0A1S3JI99_LINAN|nr:enkurin [Lingula anatina]XP_013410088.1 enkurin-like [Lingula anatina]|eukprot:XP_013392035.1 enkurin [Lingula anatina]
MLQEENIYNLIPREEVKPPKPARYTSKFKQMAREERQEGKSGYKTMGQAKVPVPTTDNFLKKHSKEPKLPPREHVFAGEPFTYPDADRRRPPVPHKEDKPLMGLRTTKNFITNNAVGNIMSVPKKPDKNFVDTRGGDKWPLDPSGLEPKFIHKKDFGQTPGYLVKRNKEVIRAQEEYEAYIAEHFRRGAMKQLSEAERQVILAGLKANWEEIHHQYQGLSVVTDTVPKKNRKERMEAEMKQLERDIETIEKHKVIYIAN